MDWADLQREKEQRDAAAPSSFEIGVVVGLPAAGRLLVNVFGTQENIATAADTRYGVNDRVIVLRSPTANIVIGRLSSSSASSVPDVLWVTGWGTPNQTLMLTDGSKAYGPYAYLASYASPSGGVYPAGDKVALLNLPGGAIVLGKLAVIPPAVAQPTPAPIVVPPPLPTPQAGQSTFNAVDARSYRNGKWRTDSAVVAQFDYAGYGDNTGAWFYGSAPLDTLRGAKITRVQVRAQRRTGGVYAAQTLHVRRHASVTRPAGVVVSVAGPTDAAIEIGQAIWIDLPVAWGQAIVDSGGGLMISGTPYVVLDGLDSDALSGALRLDWTRAA